MSVPLKKAPQMTIYLQASNKSRSSFRRAARADEADPLKIMPERPRTSRLTFAEDFILEHSLPGLQINSFEMAGSF
ncbi:MAG: hypothetical protein ABSF23_01440 [Terracidiphilus sp.]|jgi:hypothetical protein